MKKILIGTFISTSTILHAQDCGKLLDGETQRLDAPGRSLEKVKVQDQDGLGTCYANTTSVVLQSSLEGHPDVSYINLALGYAEKVNSKAENSTYSYDKNGQMLINGGTICKTIEIAKENGGVCNRKDVPLEKSLFNTDVDNFVDNAHDQKKLMEKVSRYYDDVNIAFNGQAKTGNGNVRNKFNTRAFPEISPETREKISNGFQEFGTKLKNAFTEIGNKFKNFFNSIFDREDGGKAPVIVIDNPGDNKNQDKDKGKDNDRPIVDPSPSPTPSPIDNTITENNIPDNSKADENIKLDDSTNNATVDDNSVVNNDSETFSIDKFEALKNLKRPLSRKEEYQLSLYNLLQKRLSEFALQNCKVLDSKNADEVVQNLAAYVYNANNGTYDPAISPFKYSLYTSTLIRGDGKSKTYEFIINPSVTSAIQNEYLKSFSRTPKPASGLSALTKALKTALPKYVTEKEVETALKRLDPDVLSKLEDDHKRYALNDYSKCSKDKSAYLRSDDGLVKDFSGSPCLKAYMDLGKGIQEMAVGLESKNASDINKMVNFILNSPDLNYEKSMTMILAPTCNDVNKVKIPRNLSCNENRINFSGVNENDPASYTKKLEEEKKKFRDSVVGSILGDKAVGVSLCSIFFQENPNYFYNANNNCNVSRSDGLHAVSVVGYRCKAGKLDYLIQNSWGEWRDLNSGYERDTTFGKAWINEDAMVKNSYNYSIIGNGK